MAGDERSVQTPFRNNGAQCHFVPFEIATLQLDFGYPWWLSYGQIVVWIFPALLLLLIAWKRRWAV